MIIKSINFKSAYPYSFSTVINEQQIRVHVRYNGYKDNYYFNIDVMQNGKYVNKVNSIALTTGVDLFLQYPQFRLGQLFIIPMKKDLYAKIPTAETLVNGYSILWVGDE